MTAIKGHDLRVTVQPKCPALVLTFRREQDPYFHHGRWHFTLKAGSLCQHWVAGDARSWWWGWRQLLRNADQLRARWRRDHPPEVLATGFDDFMWDDWRR